MPWYKVALTNSQVSDGELKRLQDRFMSIYIESKLPKGMAIFADDFIPLNPPFVPGKKPFIVYSVYFSPFCLPLAEKLILDYSGEPCEKPNLETCVFLAGDEAESSKH